MVIDPISRSGIFASDCKRLSWVIESLSTMRSAMQPAIGGAIPASISDARTRASGEVEAQPASASAPAITGKYVFMAMLILSEPMNRS